ncbi:MAG: hypothetical protein LBS19_01445 [Clostridiales bacterium]|jgi:16S rRNA (guanine(1405)-N(7))-methyltransferase|nr:hypothetical protein [Clostridiales bacterium]
MTSLFDEIKASKEYGVICDETINRVIYTMTGRYKSDKLTLKAIKSTLREISGAFADAKALKRAEQLIEEMRGGGDERIARLSAEVLRLHSSSRERETFFGELIHDIREATGFKSVIDIGCGFTPFHLLMIPGWRDIDYLGIDINTAAVALLNRFFELIKAKARARAGDVLVSPPEESAGCALLFKTLPLLEHWEKGAGRRLVNGLRCPFVAITFPIKSLGGRDVGMKRTYQEYMEREFAGFNTVMYKEYRNEMGYVLEPRAENTEPR